MKFDKGIYQNDDGVLFKLVGEGQSTDGSEILIIYKELYGKERFFVCGIDDFDLEWVRPW